MRRGHLIAATLCCAVIVVVVFFVLKSANVGVPTATPVASDVPERIDAEMFANEDQAAVAEAATSKSENPVVDLDAAVHAEAVGRQPRPEDVERVRDDPMLRYIQLLRNESFADGLVRFHMRQGMQEAQPLNWDGDTGSHSRVAIEFLLRTRRFAKVLTTFLDAHRAGDPTCQKLVEASTLAYLNRVSETSELILRHFREHPELLTNLEAADKDVRAESIKLISGGIFPSDPCDVSTELSLEGAKTTLGGQVFLLGLTQSPSVLKTVLAASRADGRPLRAEVVRMGLRHPELFFHEMHVNPAVVADALDRILMAQAGGNAVVSPRAKEIAEQYAQWRQTQNLPVRKSAPVYQYDAYVPRMLQFGGANAAVVARVDLPWSYSELGTSTKSQPNAISEDEIRAIVQWAEAFESALMVD